MRPIINIIININTMIIISKSVTTIAKSMNINLMLSLHDLRDAVPSNRWSAISQVHCFQFLPIIIIIVVVAVVVIN